MNNFLSLRQIRSGEGGDGWGEKQQDLSWYTALFRVTKGKERVVMRVSLK